MFENAVRCDPLLEPRVVALGILSAERKTPNPPASNRAQHAPIESPKSIDSSRRWFWSALAGVVVVGAAAVWWLQRRASTQSNHVSGHAIDSPVIASAPLKKVEVSSSSHDAREMEALARELGLMDK